MRPFLFLFHSFTLCPSTSRPPRPPPPAPHSSLRISPFAHDLFAFSVHRSLDLGLPRFIPGRGEYRAQPPIAQVIRLRPGASGRERPASRLLSLSGLSSSADLRTGRELGRDRETVKARLPREKYKRVRVKPRRRRRRRSLGEESLRAAGTEKWGKTNEGRPSRGREGTRKRGCVRVCLRVCVRARDREAGNPHRHE